MSLYLPLTKIVDSAETVVAPGAVIASEGAALIRATGAQSSGVTLSGGAAGENFVGFSIAGTSAAPFSPAYASKVEEFLVPVSGQISVAFTPVSGQISILNTATNAAIPIDGTTVTLTGKTIAGLTAGLSVRVTYQYALNVIQSRALQGDVQPGGYAGSYVSQIGLIKRGTIFTDNFDASKNWTAATAIKIAANGQLQDQTGSGVTLVGAYVVAVPNVEIPFLGIEFSAA
jgi:hypothetical protein